MIRQFLISCLLRLLHLDIPKGEDMTQEVEDGLLSQLWQNPAFRNRVAKRDKKIIYELAGGQGMKAEPRDHYVMQTGQRVENLLWASDAKKAYDRVQETAKQKSAALAKARE